MRRFKVFLLQNYQNQIKSTLTNDHNLDLTTPIRAATSPHRAATGSKAYLFLALSNDNPSTLGNSSFSYAR